MHKLRVVFQTDRYDDSVAFYSDVLGLEVADSWGGPTARGCLFAWAGTLVEFFEGDWVESGTQLRPLPGRHLPQPGSHVGEGRQQHVGLALCEVRQQWRPLVHRFEPRRGLGEAGALLDSRQLGFHRRIHVPVVAVRLRPQEPTSPPMRSRDPMSIAIVVIAAYTAILAVVLLLVLPTVKCSSYWSLNAHIEDHL